VCRRILIGPMLRSEFFIFFGVVDVKSEFFISRNASAA
jgi:hypothetical protein